MEEGFYEVDVNTRAKTLYVDGNEVRKKEVCRNSVPCCQIGHMENFYSG